MYLNKSVDSIVDSLPVGYSQKTEGDKTSVFTDPDIPYSYWQLCIYIQFSGEHVPVSSMSIII